MENPWMKPTTLRFRPGTIDAVVYRHVVTENEYRIPDHLDPDGLILDVGAHIGCFSTLCWSAGARRIEAFEADPANAGIVMDRGLWRYTRHPNYFGDACVWWGIALVAAETGTGAWGLIGAVLMTLLLRRVSGVTLLEKSLVKRRQGYEDYVARTSPFVPRPPRRAAATRD